MIIVDGTSHGTHSSFYSATTRCIMTSTIKHMESKRTSRSHSSPSVPFYDCIQLIVGDRLSGTYMAPPSHSAPAKQPTEIVVVQELGDSSAPEGSRKRRKSIVSNSPVKENGSTSPKMNGDATANGNGAIHGSPRTRKTNGAATGIGSRGMLVVGK